MKSILQKSGFQFCIICQRIQTEKSNQGQYCPSLSFNYVSINKDLEKLLPQLYHTNMKTCYEQCYVDIELS